MTSSLRGQAGAGLIEILIAVGIMGIVSMGMMTMFDNQNKQLRILAQKGDLIDLKNLLLTHLSKSSVCTWQLKNKTINNSMPTNPTTFSPTVLTLLNNTVYSGANALSAPLATDGAALSNSFNGVRVETVRVKNFYATGNPNEYRGVVEVALDPDSLQMILKPVLQPVIVKTLGPPGPADVIDSCYGMDTNTAFGAYLLRTVNVDYLADTDGLAMITVQGTPANRTTTVYVMVDGVQIAQIGTVDHASHASEGPQSLTVPVPRGKVWRMQLTTGNPANTIVRWLGIGQP